MIHDIYQNLSMFIFDKIGKEHCHLAAFATLTILIRDKNRSENAGHVATQAAITWIADQYQETDLLSLLFSG